MIIHQRLTSKVNGPANRAVIWLQGCSLSCKNCWNPDTHAFTQDNDRPEYLAEWILRQNDIEGVTWSGGEPCMQLLDVRNTMQLVKGERPDMTFGMFTGYTQDELEYGRFKIRVQSDGREPIWRDGATCKDDTPFTSSIWGDVRSMLDFAVMGRFQDAKKTTADPMRSSTNQKLVLFSDRYKESDFDMQKVEIKIRPGGLTTITGFPVGVKGI